MEASQLDFQPEFTSLVQLMKEAVTQFADRPMFGVRGTQTWEWTTYREFARLVDAFRASLVQRGISRGDRVAVISANRLEWAVGAHAVYGLGAAYVPMYEVQLDKDWLHILSDSGAKLCLVSTPAVRDRVEALRTQLPFLQHVVCFDAPESDPDSYAAALQQGMQNPLGPGDHSDSDTASIIYTSGTTGKPKGVKLTHFNLAANVAAMTSSAGIENRDRGLAFLPWAHVFGGCIELHCMMATGACTAICSDPLKLTEYLPEVKPTILFAVPRVWNRIYAGVQQKMASQPKPIQWMFRSALTAREKQRAGETLSMSESLALKGARKLLFPKVLQAFGGELRFACSGAAALSREVAEFMDTLGIEVYEGYGMTETSGCTTANPKGEARLGSVGKPIAGVKVVIDKTAPGSTERDGEIIVYGTGVMQGYNNLAEATSKTLTEDGGLRTGDIGHLDPDGYLFITGRVKEIYKLENGKYVAPAPIEEKVQLSPYIAQCVVYGDNRPHNVALIIPDAVAVGEWAKAQNIQGEGEALLQHEQVLALLEAEVSKHSSDLKGYERIHDFVVDTEELTIANGMLTPTLKLKRAQVVNKYADAFSALYPSRASDRPAPRSSYIRELVPGAASQGA